MLSILLNIFIIVVTLLVLIGFHEWGHCIAAQKLGIPVERFAIGFGKILFSKKAKSGTEYALCLFPIGGYIRFKDEDKFEQNPIYKRALIIFAGPFFNLITAFFAYWLIFTIGITEIVPQTTSGKEIVAVDHHPTKTWGAVIYRLVPHIGEKDNIIISYNNSSEIISSAKLQLPDLLTSIGILPDEKAPMKLRQYSPLESVIASIKEVVLYFNLNFVILCKLLTGVISLKFLMGPIGLFSATLYAAHQGFMIYLAFLGFISVGLAFANLLPIPGLDGSHLLYLFIESLRKKPLSLRVQMLLFRLGIILLAIIMLQALINDIGRLL